MKGGANTWRWWRVDAVGVGICVVLAGIVYYAGIDPLQRARAKQESLEASLLNRQQEADAKEQMLRDLRGQIEQIGREIADSPVKLMPWSQINERLAMLTDLAAVNDLRIDESKPGRVIPGARFDMVPIMLAGSGRYRDCTLFIHRLTDRMPDTGVISFALEAGSRSPDDSDDVEARFEFNLVWYAAPTGPR